MLRQYVHVVLERTVKSVAGIGAESLGVNLTVPPLDRQIRDQINAFSD